MAPITRRAGGRQLSNRLLSYEDITRVYSFLHNYAEDHGVSLPGRVPGYKRGDLKLLPCSSTKHDIYTQYTNAMKETGK